MSDELVFYVNGRRITDEDVDPELTLLTYLRRKLKLCGTKLGCAEGGCGACTVMISKFDRTTKTVKHYSANACLTPVCSVHGLSVTSVEGIGSIKTRLHPVQKRIAESHGSQCGFCTPGIVMSMYTLLRNKTIPSIDDIETYMQGNLCRCTGYRPILEGFKTFTEDCKLSNGTSCTQKLNSNCSLGQKCCRFNGDANGCCNGSFNADSDDEQTLDHMSNGNSRYDAYDPTQEPIFPPELMLSDKLDTSGVCFRSDRLRWHRPIMLQELTKLKMENPDARVLIGNTEIGVEVKFKNCHYPVIIAPSWVPELNRMSVTDSGVEFGSAICLTKVGDTMKDLCEKLPEYKTRVLKAILKMLHLFAGMQIRNTASLAGNIMTASPISDLNPLLLAAGVSLLVISHKGGPRKVLMDKNFFTGYRRTCVKNDEIVLSIFIPFSQQWEYFYGYKQSRRRDDDIAIVNAGMKVRFKENSDEVCQLSLAYGGVSPIAVFAESTMKGLISRKWNDSLLEDACMLLELDLPLDPGAPGGMVQFRRSLTTSFFFRFYLTVLKHLKDQKITDLDIPETYNSALHEIQRAPFHSSQLYKITSNNDRTAVGKPFVHVSAKKQASGEAVYVDDIPRIEDELYLATVYSTKAHANILKIDESKALDMTGVRCFISAKDLDSSQIMTGPVFQDEEIFASKTVLCQGQPIGAIVADSQAIAQRAAKLVHIEYEELQPIITIEDAISRNSYLGEERSICKGDCDEEIRKSDHVISGSMRIGGQEHFYLETNVTLAVPKNEDGEIEIFSSSQSPTFQQMAIAKALGVAANKIVCRVKRLGGGFGGKETRFNLLSVACAIAANKVGKPVRCMMDRDEDMMSTGTRHPFLGIYKVGVNNNGKIKALDVKLYANAGISYDLSGGVLDRALFHSDNAYLIPTANVTGYLCKTNVPSNTAFRGFGGPQGMIVAENWIEEIADELNIEPEVVRERNLLRVGDITHFNQEMENCTIDRCWQECMEKSGYLNRKENVKQFNLRNRWKKKGISIIPTKFGISFTVKFLNQAGALVHVYKDGSVLLSHAGVEMGQGLHTKMMQVASTVLDIPISKMHISETATDKVPNTSPSAASACSDLNGMAVKDACEKIIQRLKPIRAANPNGSWDDWVMAAYFDMVSLSATGFYKTPDLCYDMKTNSGRLFNYFTFGAACSEVEIDCLTGDHQVIRTDIVMDLGDSLNPSIDIGQIEGAFIQGYGLFVLEELKHSPSGFLYTRGPGMYKIPGFGDIPRKFNVCLLPNSSNPRAVFSSKAVGEPPLFLASSVFFAIKSAIKSARSDAGLTGRFQLDSPATAEKIRLACHDQFSKQFPPAKPGTYKPWDVSA